MKWSGGDLARSSELVELAARARVSPPDRAAALMAEVKRIERVVRKAQAN
jgi:hypothetical protein